MSSLKVELRIWPPSVSSATGFYRRRPLTISVEEESGFPAQLSASFVNCDPRRSESDAAEPIQEGSYVEAWRSGLCRFAGDITRVSETKSGGAVLTSITALGKDQVLNDTQALYVDGSGSVYDIWARWSDSIDLSNIALKAGKDWGDGGPRHVWWPAIDDSSTGAWISKAGSNTTTLRIAMASGVAPASGTDLKMDTTHGGLAMAGFITIGTETLEYNGYDFNQADLHWYCKNIQRGSLGSTAAAHASGDTVYSRVCKRIDPRGRIRVEGNQGGTYEIIDRVQVAPSLAAGSFAWADDPLGLGYAATYTDIRGSYTIFAEQGTPLLLSDVVSDVLTVSPSNGGPGLGGGFTDSCQVDTSGLSDLTLARCRCDRPTKAGTFLRDMFVEAGLNGAGRDVVNLRYDPEDDTLYAESMSQAATASRTYRDASVLSEDVGEERVPTMVRTQWREQSPFNLLDSNRMWHPTAATGAVDYNAPNTKPYIFHDLDGTRTWNGTTPITSGWPSNNRITIGTGGINPLTDNNLNTAWCIQYRVKPAATHELYGWFPGASATAADIWQVEEIEIVLELDTVGAGNSGGGALNTSVSVYYYDDMVGSTTGSAPTSANGPKWMSTELAAEYRPGVPGTGDSARVILKASPKVLANAISIKVDGYSTTALGVAGYGVKIVDMFVRGSRVRFEYVTLAPAWGGGQSRQLVAAESAAKLIGAKRGQYVVEVIDVGAQSREVARGMAWVRLLSGLARPRTKGATIRSKVSLRREGIAKIGETITVGRGFDEFTGVCHGSHWACAGGVESLELRLTNWKDNIVGSAETFTVAALPAPKNKNLRRSHEIRQASVGRTRILSLEAA